MDQPIERTTETGSSRFEKIKRSIKYELLQENDYRIGAA